MKTNHCNAHRLFTDEEKAEMMEEYREYLDEQKREVEQIIKKLRGNN